MKKWILIVTLAGGSYFGYCFYNRPSVIGLQPRKVDPAAKDSLASDGSWMTDFPKALKKAKAENKVLFMFFRGSDWCGCCKALEQESLSQKGFKDYAAKNLVLLDIDFPHNKTLPEALARQNAELEKRYNTDRFPTVFLLDWEGKEIGRLSYYEVQHPDGSKSPGGLDFFMEQMHKQLNAARASGNASMPAGITIGEEEPSTPQPRDSDKPAPKKAGSVAPQAEVKAAVATAGQQAVIGKSEQEVIALWGKPSGTVDVGDEKILSFAQVNVTFKEGKATACEEVHAPPPGGEWLTDYSQALASAKAAKRVVLMDFTGSDWCGWCIKLDEEVFSQRAFKDYAKNNLVLLKVDFPRGKPLPPEEQKQNQQLSGKFGVSGYPTIVIVNSGGSAIGKLGYMEGGPSAFIKELGKIVPQSATAPGPKTESPPPPAEIDLDQFREK